MIGGAPQGPRAPGLLDAVAQLCPPTKLNRCRVAVNTQLGVNMCLLTDSWIARKWGAILGQCPHLGHLLLPAPPSPLQFGARPKSHLLGFPGGAVVKNPPANAGDTGSSPGPGSSHMPRSN